MSIVVRTVQASWLNAWNIMEVMLLYLSAVEQVVCGLGLGQDKRLVTAQLEHSREFI
jgi:hypothetical protein